MTTINLSGHKVTVTQNPVFDLSGRKTGQVEYQAGCLECPWTGRPHHEERDADCSAEGHRRRTR